MPVPWTVECDQRSDTLGGKQVPLFLHRAQILRGLSKTSIYMEISSVYVHLWHRKSEHGKSQTSSFCGYIWYCTPKVNKSSLFWGPTLRRLDKSFAWIRNLVSEGKSSLFGGLTLRRLNKSIPWIRNLVSILPGWEAQKWSLSNPFTANGSDTLKAGQNQIVGSGLKHTLLWLSPLCIAKVRSVAQVLNNHERQQKSLRGLGFISSEIWSILLCRRHLRQSTGREIKRLASEA